MLHERVIYALKSLAFFPPVPVKTGGPGIVYFWGAEWSLMLN